jgi:hypothetical protein
MLSAITRNRLTISQKGQLALILFSSLSIDKGKDVLKIYQFGRETIKHNVTWNLQILAVAWTNINLTSFALIVAHIALGRETLSQSSA